MKMNGTWTFLVISLFGFVRVLAIKSTDCGTKNMEVHHAEVENCPGKVCTLKKGTSSTMHLSFSTDKAIQSFSVEIFGTVFGMLMPYPGDYQTNACINSGITCPIEPNVMNNYTLILPVKKSFPSVNVKIRFILTGDKDHKICKEILGKVVRKVKNFTLKDLSWKNLRLREKSSGKQRQKLIVKRRIFQAIGSSSKKGFKDAF